VIDSLFNILFQCRHRRTTFPLTPAGKTKSEPGETYVVCLECGKQFTYDWEHMSMGKIVDISASANGPNIDATRIPFGVKTKLRYLAWASVLPAAWWIGNAAAKSRKRPQNENESRTLPKSDLEP
jgi:hypothetical protein